MKKQANHKVFHRNLLKIIKNSSKASGFSSESIEKSMKSNRKA